MRVSPTGARASSRAFTLVELIAVMTIVGSIAGVVAPLMVSASDNYTIATRQRAAADRMDRALHRISHMIRSAPGVGGADIVIAGDSRVTFGDGSRIELLGSTIWITDASGAAAPLCQSVDEVRFWYVAADGVTDSSVAPRDTRRIRVRVRSGGVDLCTTIHLAQTEIDA